MHKLIKSAIKTSTLLCICCCHLCGCSSALLASADSQVNNSIHISYSSSTVTLPFAYNPVALPAIIVQASINGSKPLPFLIDTGFSGDLLVDQSVADTLRLKPTDQKTIIKDGLTQKLVSLAIKKYSFGHMVIAGNVPGAAVTIDAGEVNVGDLSGFLNAYPTKVVGIIGLSVLSLTRVQFDFSQHLMRVSANPITFRPDAQTLTFPLQQVDNLAYVLLPFTKGKAVMFKVDTGSTNTNITPAVVANISADATRLVPLQSIGGLAMFIEGLIKKFPVGSIQASDVLVTAVSDANGAVLGLNLLARYNFILDGPGHALVLEIYPASDVPMPGHTEIAFLPQTTTLVVDAIPNSGPAYKSGLRSGDRILAVDGQLVSQIGVGNAINLLQGNAATKAQIAVQPKTGKTAQMTFIRASMTNPFCYLPAGFLLARFPIADTTHLVTVVSKILNESSARKCGLRVGDILLAVNNISIGDLRLSKVPNSHNVGLPQYQPTFVDGPTLSQVYTLLEHSVASLTLTIIHAGENHPITIVVQNHRKQATL